MDLGIAWTVARKDLSVFLKKRSNSLSLAFFPLFVSIGLPAIIWVILGKYDLHGADAEGLTAILDAFSLWFVMMASILPTAISSYSIVGEKIERSLEPLLATPATDNEILTGKSIAAFLPTLLATYGGAAIYMILMDALMAGPLGRLYYPNWSIGVLLLIVVPLVILCSVELNVLVSSRVNDVRTANTIGGLVVLPFGALYVAIEINIVAMTIASLLRIALALFAIDIVLFLMARITFRREEILTRWK